MLRGLLVMALVAIATTAGNLTAVNYIDGPESVSWDSLNHRYLVSSFWNGRIVAIDTLGQQQLFITPGGYAYGNHIKDTILYVAYGRGVYGFHLNTGQFLWQAHIPEAGQNDGVSTDTSGYLYTVDMNRRVIFRVKLSDQSYTEFVTSGLPQLPQTLLFDAKHNRFLVVSACANAPIIAVNLPDGSLTTLVVTPMGYADGIADDQFGNVYVTSYNQGTVWRYDSTFTNPPFLFYSGLPTASSICYCKERLEMAIPMFNYDSVAFVRDLYHFDRDSDGVVDAYDNCLVIPNPQQADVDNDSVGDTCDNCVNDFNPDQADSNGNGVGNACEWICGDADGSGNVDISDAVSLIAYIFSGGPPPQPLLAGDASCDQAVDISDAVYLIAYIFAGGPAPCETCLKE